MLKINLGENDEIINKIIKVVFDKYGPHIYELIKIQIPFDDETKKIFNNQNSIIVYNSCEKKCFNINRMKSKCFQFFCFINNSNMSTMNNICRHYHINCFFHTIFLTLSKSSGLSISEHNSSFTSNG